MANLSEWFSGISFVKPFITRDKGLEDQFFKDLKDNMSFENKSRLDSIHVSDLVYCLRKAFYRRKGYAEKETPESLTVKSLGKGHHHIYETLRDSFKEYEASRYGVVGHLDMFNGYPIEIKTTRKKFNEYEVPEHYLRQIAYYCILTGTKIGYLIYVYVVKPKIRVFKIDYSETLDRYKYEFFNRLNLLKKALKEDNPSFLDGSNYRWECRYCPYHDQCDKRR